MSSTIVIALLVGAYLYIRVRRTLSSASTPGSSSSVDVLDAEMNEPITPAQVAPEYFTYEAPEPPEAAQPAYQRASTVKSQPQDSSHFQSVESASPLQDFDLRQAVIAQTILENPYLSR